MVEATLRGHVYTFTGALLAAMGLLGVGWPYTLLLGSTLLLSAYLLYRLAERYEESVVAATVSRKLEKQVAMEGEDVEVSLEIRETSGTGMPLLEVADYTPPRASPSSPGHRGAATLPARGTVETRYKVRAFFGTHVFPGTLVSGGDAFGLFTSPRFVAETSVFRVLPYYSGALETMLSSTLPWPGETSRVRRRGHGLEFYEIREYMPGDDPRRIVWTATARTGRLMVREDEVETRAKLMIFVDLSKDMLLGAPGETSADHVARAAASLAAYAARMGDLVGYTIFLGDKWFTRPPARGVEVVEELAGRLSMASPGSVRPRFLLARAVDDFLRYSEGCIALILSGTGILREGTVSTLATALAEDAWRSLLAVLLPSPRDKASRLINMVEKSYYSRLASWLEDAGIRVIVADGWAWVEVLPVALGEVRLRVAA